jgi:E3 ubiquitin-protein ligase RNF115/126
MSRFSSGPGTGSFNVLFAPPMLMGRLASHVIVSADGLDDVITMLLSQLDEAGTGAPPASKDEIDALPTIEVLQEQVDACLQCNICMEDFQLDERVRSLPCKHIYHGICITPWLQLHGTCPICRHTVNSPPPAANTTSSSATTAAPAAAESDTETTASH